MGDTGNTGDIGRANPADDPIEVSLPDEVPAEYGPYGGAPLPPHLLVNRPFLWLILGEIGAGIAFWAFLSTVFADAVYRFDAIAPEMALLGASLSVPFILFIPLQGMLVDRWSPKWLNICGYVVLAAAMAVAMAATSMQWLYAAALLVGVAFSSIEPARSALTGLMIKRGSLVRANGMISAAFQGSLLVGTLLSAALLANGPGATVYLVALLIADVALPFNLLIPDLRQGGERPSLSFGDLAQGVSTSWRLPPLRLLIFVTGIGWMMINAFWVLEPQFIEQVLHRGEHAVPLLWSAHGVGAILGAVLVARLRDAGGKEPRYVGFGVVLVGVGMLLYTGPAIYAVSFVGAAFTGAGVAFIFAPLLALIQRIVPEEQRGRVTSVYSAMQEGMGLGAAVFILVASSVIVVRPTLMAAGIIALVTGLLGIRGSARLARRGDG